MEDKERQDIALFRYGILAPLISGITNPYVSNKEFFRNAAKHTYTHPKGHEITISPYSLERWFHAYQKEGFNALIPKRRIDSGTSRKLDADITEQIIHLKKEYPRLPATIIHQKLLDNGTITKGYVSLSTITRFINKLDIKCKNTNYKDMKRYERAHINEVWYADSSTGLFLKVNGKKKRIWIIATLDDASRMVTGIDMFFNDNYVNVMSVLKSAITKYGKPKILSIDNGSAYKNKQITLLAARIGTTLNYNQPYTPTSKAKLERWFRSLKDQWMSTININDFSSLNELRDSLFEYVGKYNNSVHSSLKGKSPTDRFFLESSLIKRLSDEQLEKCFLLEIHRRVSVDNVIVIDNTEFEVPYRYSKQRIILRYSSDFKSVYVIDSSTGELIPIKLLNKKDNANIKRHKVKLTGGAL